MNLNNFKYLTMRYSKHVSCTFTEKEEVVKEENMENRIGRRDWSCRR